MELNREHFRAIIFHNFRCGLTQQQCINGLNSVVDDEAPSKDQCLSMGVWLFPTKRNMKK